MGRPVLLKEKIVHSCTSDVSVTRRLDPNPVFRLRIEPPVRLIPQFRLEAF